MSDFASAARRYRHKRPRAIFSSKYSSISCQGAIAIRVTGELNDT